MTKVLRAPSLFVSGYADRTESFGDSLHRKVAECFCNRCSPTTSLPASIEIVGAADRHGGTKKRNFHLRVL